MASLLVTQDMKFSHFPVIGTLLLAASLAIQAAPETPEIPKPSKTETPNKIDPLELVEEPFRYNGLVTVTGGSGSGFCAWSNKTFFTAGHVLYDKKVWGTPPVWYPVANSELPDKTTAIQSRGYYRWANYSTLFDASEAIPPTPGQLGFSRDVVLAFSFKKLISGKPATLNLNGVSDLKRNIKTLITGYPKVNPYLATEIDGYFMHKTGPIVTPYEKYAGNALYTTLVTTGPGNSGGPVWTKNKRDSWDAAGVLVGGRPSESIVYAFSKDTNSLLQAVAPVIKKQIGKPRASASVKSFTTFFPCYKSMPIPDGVRRWTSFSIPVNTFSSDAKVTSLTISLDIRTAHRGDLFIVLVSPSGIEEIVHNEGGANAKNLILDSKVLTRFSTTKATGNWQLRVQDRLKGDIATFKSAVLQIGAFEPLKPIEIPIITP
jgi:V8-like Glu-specific endopeptidase